MGSSVSAFWEAEKNAAMINQYTSLGARANKKGTTENNRFHSVSEPTLFGTEKGLVTF